MSVEEALQILQSAIGYCQRAGLKVRGANSEGGLTLVIPGVAIAVGQSGQGIELRVETSLSNIGSTDN